MKEVKEKKKPILFYYIVALAVIFIFNAIARPYYDSQSVKQVDYGTFMNMTEDEQIADVQIEENQILFKDKDGKEYRTGVVNDPQLTERLHKAKVSFNEVIKEKDSPFTDFLIAWILPILIFFGIGHYFNRRLMNRGGGNSLMFGAKNQVKVYVPSANGIHFDDVAGEDEAKENLSEIVDFLHHPDKYAKIGAKMPKGVLLVGPPGTGKTMLAKAVAGEAGVPFFPIAGSEFVEMFVGMGASKVRDLFQQAKQKAPCIIFIDEIDAIGQKRTGNAMGNSEREQTLNQLLVEMDGFGANEGVIVIAATNRQDILDPALLRPGRFDRQVYVGEPDMKGREAILRVHARGKQFDPDVRFDSIAKSTAGFTGADLENLLNEAALLAARRNKRLISMEDIEDSFLKVIMGTEKKSRVMSEREKKLTAYHEAGHAIATRCLPTQDPVHTVSIVPRGRAGGFTMSLPQEEKFYASKKEMLDDLIVLLGGRVAEKLTMDDISTGASNDIERATSVAKSMVTKYGMSDVIGPINYSSGQQEIFLGREMVERSDSISEDLAAKIDGEIRKVILDAYTACENILKEHMEQLTAVAEYLIRNETMDGDAFEKLFQGEEVPDHATGEQLFHLESGMAKTAAQDAEKTQVFEPKESHDDGFQPMAGDTDQTQKISLDDAVTKLFVQEDKSEEDDPTNQDDG